MIASPDGKPAPRVGVAVIIWRGRQVLMMQRRGPHGGGTWSVPGGHLDHGEKPEDCAAREAREEVGVEVTGLRFSGITSDVFEDTGLHYITLWFEADHASGDPAVAAPDELDAVGWYGWDNLPRPLFLPLENYTAGRAYRP